MPLSLTAASVMTSLYFFMPPSLAALARAEADAAPAEADGPAGVAGRLPVHPASTSAPAPSAVRNRESCIGLVGNGGKARASPFEAHMALNIRNR